MNIVYRGNTCGPADQACKICFETVTPKTGIQCDGACKTWVHFKCLNYPPGKIADIKNGYIKICCPCPDCTTADVKEVILNKDNAVLGSCGNSLCPANLPQKCGAEACPANRSSESSKPIVCSGRSCNVTESDISRAIKGGSKEKASKKAAKKAAKKASKEKASKKRSSEKNTQNVSSETSPQTGSYEDTLQLKTNEKIPKKISRDKRNRKAVISKTPPNASNEESPQNESNESTPQTTSNEGTPKMTPNKKVPKKKSKDKKTKNTSFSKTTSDDNEPRPEVIKTVKIKDESCQGGCKASFSDVRLLRRDGVIKNNRDDSVNVETLSLKSVEKMCNTVGQLAKQIDELMVKMKTRSKTELTGCKPNSCKLKCNSPPPMPSCPKPCRCKDKSLPIPIKGCIDCIRDKIPNKIKSMKMFNKNM